MEQANIYHSIVEKLSTHYSKSEAQSMARILIEDVLQLPFARVMAGIDNALCSKQADILNRCIARLLKDEPIQYITGRTAFMGREFEVTNAVLIPRPETEGLVRIACRLFDDDGSPLVMDACTGSGCIGVSIKKERPEWKVQACDISVEALSLAKKNASNNHADVDFMTLDILSKQRPSGPYDLIVSNPPYVMESEKADMQKNVLDYEPEIALFVSDHDPLIFYKALAEWGMDALGKNGYILVEINALLAKETAMLMENCGYHNIETLNDIYNNKRFILCQK